MSAGPRIRLARVSEDAITVAEHERWVADPAAGAVVSFAGVVRDHDHGRDVVRLHYEAHPTAGRVVAEAAESRGLPVVFADNAVLPLPGEADLDERVRALAAEAARWLPPAKRQAPAAE